MPAAAEWFKELDELRLRREPAYDTPGLAVAYATRYVVRRTVSLLGALMLAGGLVPPRTVVDFGSGTGATAVAFDLLPFPGSRTVIGIEPSQEMRQLAACLQLSSRTVAIHRDGSLDDIVSALRSPIAPQMAVFSACFPYGFEGWGDLAASFGEYQRSTSPTVIVIEPEVKAAGLRSLRTAFRRLGWPVILASSRDVPAFLTANELPLNRLTRVWRRVGVEGGRPPASWWSPPDDYYLIANPIPGWTNAHPSAGTPIPMAVR